MKIFVFLLGTNRITLSTDFNKIPRILKCVSSLHQRHPVIIRVKKKNMENQNYEEGKNQLEKKNDCFSRI